MPTWRRLLAQRTRMAFSLDALSAGRSIAARIAIMAITTSSSIRVKPPRLDARHAGLLAWELWLIMAEGTRCITVDSWPGRPGGPGTHLDRQTVQGSHWRRCWWPLTLIS